MKIIVNKLNTGLRIKQIRSNLGDTLEEFGKRIEADKSNILRWEQGKTLPNKQRLKAISILGNISLNELIYGSIDEFLENNFSNLILDYKYPYPLSFDFNTYLKKYKLEASETIDINSIDEVIRVFYKILDDYIEHVIGLDYMVLQTFLNNSTIEIETPHEENISLDSYVLNSIISKNENMKEIIDEFELKLKNSNMIDYFSKLQIEKGNISQESIKYYPIAKELLLTFKKSNNEMIHNTFELLAAANQFVNEHGNLELIENENIREILRAIITDVLKKNGKIW